MKPKKKKSVSTKTNKWKKKAKPTKKGKVKKHPVNVYQQKGSLQVFSELYQGLGSQKKLAKTLGTTVYAIRKKLSALKEGQLPKFTKAETSKLLKQAKKQGITTRRRVTIERGNVSDQGLIDQAKVSITKKTRLVIARFLITYIPKNAKRFDRYESQTFYAPYIPTKKELLTVCKEYLESRSGLAYIKAIILKSFSFTTYNY